MPIEYPTTRLMRFGYVTTTNGAITGKPFTLFLFTKIIVKNIQILKCSDRVNLATLLKVSVKIL